MVWVLGIVGKQKGWNGMESKEAEKGGGGVGGAPDDSREEKA